MCDAIFDILIHWRGEVYQLFILSGRSRFNLIFHVILFKTCGSLPRSQRRVHACLKYSMLKVLSCSLLLSHVHLQRIQRMLSFRKEKNPIFLRQHYPLFCQFRAITSTCISVYKILKLILKLNQELLKLKGIFQLSQFSGNFKGA